MGKRRRKSSQDRSEKSIDPEIRALLRAADRREAQSGRLTKPATRGKSDKAKKGGGKRSLDAQKREITSRGSQSDHPLSLDNDSLPGRTLLPSEFLEMEMTFFSDLDAARARLTGDEVRSLLQAHLRLPFVAGASYGNETNYDWTVALSSFLEAAGLRVACLGAKCDGRPALPRYYPAKNGATYQFKTQHFDDAGHQRQHGGPQTIPSYEVVFAQMTAPPAAKKILSRPA